MKQGLINPVCGTKGLKLKPSLHPQRKSDRKPGPITVYGSLSGQALIEKQPVIQPTKA